MEVVPEGLSILSGINGMRSGVLAPASSPASPLWRASLEDATRIQPMQDILHLLAEQKDTSMTQRYLNPVDSGTDSEEDWTLSAGLLAVRDIHGRTALGVACQEGNAGLVRLLLSHGDDLNSTADLTSDSTCLHLASASLWVSVLLAVRDRSHALDASGATWTNLLGARDAWGRTPCNMA